MRCEAFDEMLDRLMDDALSDEERAALEAHALECPDCGRKLNETRQLMAILKEMPEEVDVPLKAQAAWRNAVRAEASRARTKRVFRYGSVAAAVVVLALGIGMGFGRDFRPNKENNVINGSQTAVSADVVVDGNDSDMPVEAAEANAEVKYEAPAQAVDGSAAKSAQYMVAPQPESTAMPAPTAEPMPQAFAANSEPEAGEDAMVMDVADEEMPMVYDDAAAYGDVLDSDEAVPEMPVLYESAAMNGSTPAMDDGEYGLFGMSAMVAPNADMAEAYIAADGMDDLEDAEEARETNPTHQISMTVADVDAACSAIFDALTEYEGSVEEQRTENGQVNLYITLPGENLEDFFSAIDHLNVAEEALDIPESVQEGQSSLLLVLKAQAD